MPDFKNLVQRAVYFGIGLADFAQEQAATKIQELQAEAQKRGEELVKRGEMNANDLPEFIDRFVKTKRQGETQVVEENTPERGEPRSIEIVEESAAQEPPQSETSDDPEQLRREVEALKEELNRLK